MQTSDGPCKPGDFTFPAVNDSNIPGLLGLFTLKRLRPILDTVNNKLYCLGPGDFDLAAAMPPGTECFDLDTAPSGHLLLPITKYAELEKQKANGSLNIDNTPISLLTVTPPGLQK